MTRADRYIAKIFWGYFIGGLVVFITIFLAIDMLSFALRYSDAGVQTLSRYYLYFLPMVAYQMVPVGCLLGTVFTLTSLSRSHELVAFYSMGMSLMRVCVPILVSVAMISILTFWAGDQVLPRASRNKSYVEYVEIKKRPGLFSTVNTNRIWYRSENILFNIQTLNLEKASAQGLTMYYFDAAWNLVQVIAADAVQFVGNEWLLEKGSVTIFSETNSFPLNQEFASKKVVMNEDFGDMHSTTNSSEMMSLKELKRFISRNKDAGLDTLRYEVDFHSKFGFAGAALVMSLLGIPFSVKRARSGGAAMGLGLCLLVAFGYWMSFSSSVTMGQHGMLPPMVASWLPNLVMAAMAAWLIRRLRQ